MSLYFNFFMNQSYLFDNTFPCPAFSSRNVSYFKNGSFVLINMIIKVNRP